MSNIVDIKLHSLGWFLWRDGERVGFAFNLDGAKRLAREKGCRVRIVWDSEPANVGTIRYTPRGPRVTYCKGCGKPGVRRLGYCDKCYYRLTIHDVPAEVARHHRCCVNGCDRLRDNCGFCGQHYWRVESYARKLGMKAGEFLAWLASYGKDEDREL